MVEIPTKNELAIVSLYRSNYRAMFHVREMALLLKTAHTTLLPHLQTLEKNNILVPKNVGRSKTYSLNISNISAKQYVLFAEQVTSLSFSESLFLLKKIKTLAFDLQLAGSIILFGSYAKQLQKKGSDIDILYIGTETEVESLKEHTKMYGSTVQIKTVTRKIFESALRNKDPLIWEIVKNHVLLHHEHFFVEALWRYFHEIKTNS